MTPLPDEELANETTCMENKCNTEMAILGQTSRSTYTNIRTQLIRDFGLDPLLLPSYHTLCKGRPKINPLLITPNAHYFSYINYNIISDVLGVDNTHIRKEKRLCPSSIKKVLFPETGSNLQEMDLDDSVATLHSHDELYGAKIEGNYETYLNFLSKKHITNSRVLEGNIMVVDSYDGSEH